MKKPLAALAASIAVALFASQALADEARIRKNLSERLPDFPKIDEVSKTPIPGIFELRVGSDVLYTDAEGNHILEGQVIDTRTRANLTEARIAKLTAIDFSKLPLKDAIVWKQGTGARKLVVFADPNCGYCKRFEKDLNQVKDVTVYTFIYPILGPDSTEKSRNVLCAKDSMKVWRDWMLEGVAIPAAAPCDASALQRNIALGRKHRITGTPALVFEDGTQKPGALPPAQVEQLLASSKAKS